MPENTQSNIASGALVPESLNHLLEETTASYLATVQPDIEPDVLEAELMRKIEDAIEIQNALRPKGRKWVTPKHLPAMQIVQIMLHQHCIKNVRCTSTTVESEYDLLAIYQPDGPEAGTYQTSASTIRRLITDYNKSITIKECDEVVEKLKLFAEHAERNTDRDLIAVNNGIFNYKTKTLIPFSPDFIFLTKTHTDYVPNAVNPVIHNPVDGTDWDVESWLSDLSDDTEIVNLLWEILGAIIRPFVRWNKAAWFYSNTGNNGKGTLCVLMRNLCGGGAHASVSLSDFGKEYVLETLVHANAIIVDENDVGTFIDKAANLKAIITNDTLQINRKFKTPIAFQFFGFMVQCLNEMPRVKDKSDSFYRRQLFVPFQKCFTGAERKYIKDDYLNRPEVLEYVLCKVLNMDYYALSEPAACMAALEDYKEYNDPIREFCDEILPQCVWDLLPFSFLYDLYRAWFRKNMPSGSPQGRNTFINDVVSLLPNYPDWYCTDRKCSIKPGRKMDEPEMLILEYDLQDWMNPMYRSGPNKDKICMPLLKATYNGIMRTVPGTGPKPIKDDEETQEDEA